MSLLGYLKSFLPSNLELKFVPAKDIRVGDKIRLGDEDLTVTGVRNATKLTKSSPKLIVIEAERLIVSQGGSTLTYNTVFSFKLNYGIRVWRSDRG